VEDQLELLLLLLGTQARKEVMGLRESLRQLEDGLVGPGEGVTLLPEEDVCQVSLDFWS
jgi:hypothetical protein